MGLFLADSSLLISNFFDSFISTFAVSIKEFKKKYNDETKVPRPSHWSGWNLSPSSIEFWLDGDSRIHERLNYTTDKSGKWIKSLLSP